MDEDKWRNFFGNFLFMQQERENFIVSREFRERFL